MCGMVKKIPCSVTFPVLLHLMQLMLMLDEIHSKWAGRSGQTHLSHSTARTDSGKTSSNATVFVKLVDTAAYGHFD